MAHVGKTARNERRKIEATLANTVGLATFLSGFLEPFFSHGFTADSLLRLFLCALVLLVMHLWAKDLLSGLED